MRKNISLIVVLLLLVTSALFADRWPYGRKQMVSGTITVYSDKGTNYRGKGLASSLTRAGARVQLIELHKKSRRIEQMFKRLLGRRVRPLRFPVVKINGKYYGAATSIKVKRHFDFGGRPGYNRGGRRPAYNRGGGNNRWPQEATGRKEAIRGSIFVYSDRGTNFRGLGMKRTLQRFGARVILIEIHKKSPSLQRGYMSILRRNVNPLRFPVVKINGKYYGNATSARVRRNFQVRGRRW